MNTIDEAELEKRFTHHPPKDDFIAALHEMARRKYRELAEGLVNSTPASREQSLALTHLEESLMWANAAIARNQGDGS